ncbi:MAG: hypothetical protein K6T78_09210 [Alicyclobacillus sp.]|nr:hypothetical protein [Alicyclobacillus sp.]
MTRRRVWAVASLSVLAGFGAWSAFGQTGAAATPSGSLSLAQDRAPVASSSLWPSWPQWPNADSFIDVQAWEQQLAQLQSQLVRQIQTEVEILEQQAGVTVPLPSWVTQPVSSLATTIPDALGIGTPSTSATGSAPGSGIDSVLPSGTQPSQNWAGYIDTPAPGATPYRSVSATWTVPKTTGRSGSVAAQWIGLGGVTSEDLLQTGTMEQISNGQATAEVFWEELPNTAQPLLTVPIGSTVTASIEQGSGATWTIDVTVRTPSGQTLTKNVPVTLGKAYAEGIGTSAEWVSEDPSNADERLYPLADAGTVVFTRADVNGQALSAPDNRITPVAMVDGLGHVVIAPSALGTDGASFTTQTESTSMESTGNGRWVPGEGRNAPGDWRHALHTQSWGVVWIGRW